MMGDVMSERGLASRDNRGVLPALGVADAAGHGDEAVLGRGSAYGGWGDCDRDQARPDRSGLAFAFLR